MREIKFRGFDTNSKVWRYGSYFCKEDTTLCPIHNSKEQWEKDKKENEHHLIIWNGFSDWELPKPHYQSEVDGDSVGQYTGLHDKNGKEIYEGDIVKFDLFKYEKHILTTISEVKYDEELSGFSIVVNNYGHETRGTLGGWLKESNVEIEVIGNIYKTQNVAFDMIKACTDAIDKYQKELLK